MRKGVAFLVRYREVSLQTNGRYLDALAAVDNPANAKRDLDRVSTPKTDTAGRRSAGFNPLARHDTELFHAFMDGVFAITGLEQVLSPKTAHLSSC